MSLSVQLRVTIGTLCLVPQAVPLRRRTGQGAQEVADAGGKPGVNSEPGAPTLYTALYSGGICVGGYPRDGPSTKARVLKTTLYFETVVLRKRPYIRREWCERILANPLRREAQPDGRIRFWGRVPEFGNRIFRVVTLEDGETVHNAFPDRDFVMRHNGREQDR